MKICPRCGKKSKNKAAFCYSCGEKLEETVRPESGASKNSASKKAVSRNKIVRAFFSNPKLLAASAALLAVVILLIVIIASAVSSAGGKYIYPDGETKVITDKDAVYLISSKGNMTVLETDSAAFNELCSVGLHIVYNLHDNSDEQALYYYNGRNAVRIANGVNASEAVLSFDGKTVVYTLPCDDKSSTGGSDIYIYSGGKSKKVASDVYLTAVSPDGKTVAYDKDLDPETNSFKGCYYDGKERVLGTNKQVFAISNGGRYVYLRRINSSDTVCYVQKGTKEQSRYKLGNDLTVGTDISSPTRCYFSYDMSKLLYIGNDGGTYLTENGKEPLKISSETLRPILPKNVFSGVGGSVIGVKSFGEKFFYNAESREALYLNSKNETATVLTDQAINPFLADDGKTLIYFEESGSIKKKDGTKTNSEPVTLVETDTDCTSGFIASGDGKAICYQDTSDGGWYFKKGTSKPKLLTDETITKAGFMGNTVYYTSDGMLYASSSGKSKRAGKFADDVTLYGISDSLITVYTSDEGRYYLSTNGRSFKLINDDQ